VTVARDSRFYSFLSHRQRFSLTDNDAVFDKHANNKSVSAGQLMIKCLRIFSLKRRTVRSDWASYGVGQLAHYHPRPAKRIMELSS